MSNGQGFNTPEAAWAYYLATMDDLRGLITSTPRFQATPQHRAKAYHALLEVQAMVYNFGVAPRLRHPRVQINTSWQTDFYALGQNCPDFFYGTIIVDGRQRYRLHGRMGDVKFILLQVHNGLPGNAGVKQSGTYDISREGRIDDRYGSAQFLTNPDGTFELILGPDKEEGNWIPLDRTSGYNYIMVRRAMTDWQDDPGELYIDQLNTLPEDYYDYEEFDEADIATRIFQAANFARYLFERWLIGLYDRYFSNAGNRKNVMSLLPGQTTSQVGSPLCEYSMCIYEIENDEALLLEMDHIPDGPYWSFQLGDVWSIALNFTDHQSSINLRHGVLDSDGIFRAVVCHRDPGYANWLDTTGRVEGVICFRNYRSTFATVPVARLVKLSELDRYLSESPKITPAERAAALRHRRQGFRMLHHE